MYAKTTLLVAACNEVIKQNEINFCRKTVNGTLEELEDICC